MINQKSKFSLYAVLVLILGIVAVGVYIMFQRRDQSSQTVQADIIAPASIPFKVGENNITIPRSLDLAGKIIGLGGSLITLEDAKQRGIIEGVYMNGKELNSSYLLSPNSSFIIRVKDINSAPALFF